MRHLRGAVLFVSSFKSKEVFLRRSQPSLLQGPPYWSCLALVWTVKNRPLETLVVCPGDMNW